MSNRKYIYIIVNKVPATIRGEKKPRNESCIKTAKTVKVAKSRPLKKSLNTKNQINTRKSFFQKYKLTCFQNCGDTQKGGRKTEREKECEKMNECPELFFFYEKKLSMAKRI